jgi:uncharacterized membrane protein YqjE
MRILDGTRALRMMQVTRSVVADVRDFRRNTFRLARLDAELAATSVISVVVLSVIGLLLALTGWALLMSALVAWIADNWLSLPAALLVVALIVLAAAISCVLFVKMRARNVAFEATRRQIRNPNRESQPARSAEQIRREIAVLESHINGEKRHLQKTLSATRGLLRDTLSSPGARAGLFVAAVAAGALAGLRSKAKSDGAGEQGVSSH